MCLNKVFKFCINFTHLKDEKSRDRLHIAIKSKEASQAS